MSHNPHDNNLRLDTVTVEQRISYYPENLREAVLWLACYVREECNRDLDLLMDQAALLGIETDKTTWSKVLRGLLQRDAGGNDLASPIIKHAALLENITRLRNDHGRKRLAGRVPFIPTPTSKAVFNLLDTLRAVERINRFGMLVGHTGRQKTASITEYCRQNNHLACVRVEAPESPSLSQFITDLAEKYGVSRQANWDKKRARIRDSVNSRRTIIVENIQRLYAPKDGGNQRVFSYLQKLQDDTGCAILLTLTPVFRDMLKQGVANGFFEQFIGRIGGERQILTLTAHSTAADISAIATAFGLKNLDAEIAWNSEGKARKGTVREYLMLMSREPGRDRVLFEYLQQAKVIAGKNDLTIDHVREARGED